MVRVLEFGHIREEIPKGFRPKAQGCEACLPRRTRRRQARATLGQWTPNVTTRNGVAAEHERKLRSNGMNVMCGNETQPRWGRTVCRAGIPRVGAMRQPWALGRNPVGILGRVHTGTALMPLSRSKNAQTPERELWFAPSQTKTQTLKNQEPAVPQHYSRSAVAGTGHRARLSQRLPLSVVKLPT